MVFNGYKYSKQYHCLLVIQNSDILMHYSHQHPMKAFITPDTMTFNNGIGLEGQYYKSTNHRGQGATIV